MTSSRRKGKRGELEVAALLRDLLGAAVVRNLTQARDGGHDLIGIPGWAVEVKRAATAEDRGVVEAGGGASKWMQAGTPLPRRSIPVAGPVGAGGRRLGLRGTISGCLTWTPETSLEVFTALVGKGRVTEWQEGTPFMSATGRSPARVAQDVYPTPPGCIEKLLPYIDFSRQGCEGPPVMFFEPCRGDGAISDLIPEHVIKGHCEIREGTDYLATPVSADIIITNPPYSLALEFLRKSLSEAPTVVYLLRLNFLGSVARKPFWDAHPPTHLFTITPRPRFVNGGSDSCGVRLVLLGSRRAGFDGPEIHYVVRPVGMTVPKAAIRT